MNLLVVGSLAFDQIETPFGKTGKILGGAATYIAMAAAYEGAEPGIVSAIGGDFPDVYTDALQKRNIDLEGVQILSGEKTFFWSGRYHNDMNTRDTLETRLNALEKFNPVLPESYRNARYVMLGNLDPEIQCQALAQVKNPELVILDTMNYWMDHTRDALLEVLKRVDVLAVNDEEARQLSGEYALVKAARKIRELGPGFVLIKRGEYGALLFRKDEVFFAPALPLESVFDPTGAGDAFAGGFAGYLAATDNTSFENMRRAVIHGSALASFTVERFGTEKIENLTREMIEARLREFLSLTHVDISLEKKL
ncbi:MAG: PfkB family carbohydrate kinase [Flavobacteriales bacterium]